MLLWTLGCMYLFRLVVLVSFRYMLRSGSAGSYGSSRFGFLRNLCCSPQWRHQFAFPPTVCKRSLLSTRSPASVTCLLFGDISLWFWLLSPWLLLLVSIFSRAGWPSAFPLCKIIYSVLLPFSKVGLFFFSMLSCVTWLCVLDINSLSAISFANIFSHSFCCLFILLMIAFDVQEALSWIRPRLFIFALTALTVRDRAKNNCRD